jgi:uncharacterized protein (DUF2384 family)
MSNPVKTEYKRKERNDRYSSNNSLRVTAVDGAVDGAVDVLYHIILQLLSVLDAQYQRY